MAAIFSFSVFDCCRQRRKKSVIPDEESRLIPAESTEPIPAIPNVVIVDHQKLKAKLGTIVRSKEGKMVNVNAQIPFNLHNQAVSHTLDPSSSRSASLHRYEFPQISQRPPIQPGLTAAPMPSQLASSSRAPSISRSSSTASATYDSRRGSLAPSETGANDMDVYKRNPILNIRLVKGYGSIAVANPPSRTGRPRVRGGDGGSRPVPADNPGIVDIANGDALTGTAESKGKDTDLEQHPQKDPREFGHLEGETPVSVEFINPDATPRQNYAGNGPGLNLDLTGSKPLSQPDFNINAGSIALSWGD